MITTAVRPEVHESICRQFGREIGPLVALGLSPGQAKFYHYVFIRTARLGYQPSTREFMDHFGWTSLGAHHGHVAGLRKKGWLGPQVGGGGSRSYRFLRRLDGGPFLGFTPIKETR